MASRLILIIAGLFYEALQVLHVATHEGLRYRWCDTMKVLLSKVFMRAMNTEKLGQQTSMADKTLTLHCAN